jgi:hypothetical protein
MAVIRNSANTVMRGRVGQTTFYFSNGQQIARQAKNNSNYGETARRSEAQQVRRVMWANLVNFYKLSASWMPKAFESKKRNQTDYNKFMQLNIGSAGYAFTKEEAAAGACIAAGFIVSQGSLPSIDLTFTVNGWRSDLSLGGLNIDNTTTVGAFSEALIENNISMRSGMQLSFASYTQMIDPLGIPRVISRLYEVTLDPSSTDILRDYLPELASTVVGGYLGVSASAQKGAFTYIASELVGGALKVSTQQLTRNPLGATIYYQSQEQINKAVASYGLDQEVILNPDTVLAQEVAPEEIYISSVSQTREGVDVTVEPGEYFGTWSLLNNTDTALRVIGIGDNTVTQAFVTDEGSHNLLANNIVKVDDIVTLRFTVTGSQGDRIVTAFTLLLDNGSYVSASFAVSQE